MRILLTIILLNSFALFAQISIWNEFTPKGYTILDTAKGDLNQDGLMDELLILKHENESTDTIPTTPVLIIEGQKDGSFKLVEKNDDMGLSDPLTSPYPNISITKNYFSIGIHGRGYAGKNYEKSTQWYRTIEFRFNSKTKEYILYKDSGGYFDVLIPDKTIKEKYNRKQWSKIKFTDYTVSYKD
jgi:hypothetical protein